MMEREGEREFCVVGGAVGRERKTRDSHGRGLAVDQSAARHDGVMM